MTCVISQIFWGKEPSNSVECGNPGRLGGRCNCGYLSFVEKPIQSYESYECYENQYDCHFFYLPFVLLIYRWDTNRLTISFYAS